MSGNNAAEASLRRLGRSIRRVGKTHYPRFLFGLETSPGDIPIFIYHDVDPEIFTQDLTFLKENNYRTLSTDQFLQEQGNPSAERAVLLTFDDARRNFWEVAFPLLHNFNAHATLFVPTYWMGKSKNYLNSVEMDNPAHHQFMTWEQLRMCSQSGIVDVQSHAHRHALVYTSLNLVGFTTPSMLAQYDLYDWPMRRYGNKDILGRPVLGTPIYEAAPLLSAQGRVLENGEVVRGCQEFVANQGGERFFSSRDWRTRLDELHSSLAPLDACDRREDPNFKSLVQSEFQLSRKLFEEELRVPPRFLAYPWMLGSTLSMQLAKDAGIRVVFGVGLDFHRIKCLKGFIPAFGRYKGDWLRFLPGHNRLNILRIFPSKIRQFFKTQHLAH